MEIKDKVVIITGASQGIGLATAKHISKLGAKVVLVARSEDIIRKLEKELPDSLAIITDMRKEEDIKNLVNKTIQKYKRIDILINNAGQGMYGPVENMNINDYKKIIELNVYGVLSAMQKVIPIMRKQKKGIIINVGSGTAKRYIPGVGAYSSTKYAANALSFIARQELEKDNITVSVINPKITETNFVKNAIGSRPDFTNRPDLKIDKAEYVAEKIAELIKSEEAEMTL